MNQFVALYFKFVDLQVNSEFYTGWLDYWGGGHAHGNTKAIIDTLTQMMNMGANVNMCVSSCELLGLLVKFPKRSILKARFFWQVHVRGWNKLRLHKWWASLILFSSSREIRNMCSQLCSVWEKGKCQISTIAQVNLRCNCVLWLGS